MSFVCLSICNVGVQAGSQYPMIPNSTEGMENVEITTAENLLTYVFASHAYLTLT